MRSMVLFESVIALVAVGLAWYAWSSRRRAVEQSFYAGVQEGKSLAVLRLAEVKEEEQWLVVPASAHRDPTTRRSRVRLSRTD